MAALIFSLPIRSETRLLQELENSGHALFFGLAAMALLPDRKAGFFAYLIAAVFAAALGICVELMQWAEGKDAEALDVVRDAAGSAAFLGIAWTFQHGRSFKTRFLIPLACLVVMVSILLPPALTAAALAYRWHEFPVIADFCSPLESRLFSTAKAQFSRISLKNGCAGQVEFQKVAPYSSFAINGPFPEWVGYRDFALTIDSDRDRPIRLYLRIHDSRHDNSYEDRYNAEFDIRPGRNKITIPLSSIKDSPRNRSMDMRSIRAIGLFVMRPEESVRLIMRGFQLAGKS